jgi:hypothetical protein
MMDFDDADVGVNHSSLAEEAVETVSQMALVSRPETRALLERHSNTPFRAKQLDASNPKAVVGQLSSTFLIEDSGREFGRVTDWVATERALTLIEALDEHKLYLTSNEADALRAVGAPVFLLPAPAVSWQTADVPVELAGPQLRRLHSVDLIERERQYIGSPDVWNTTQRLRDIASVAWEVVTDD